MMESLHRMIDAEIIRCLVSARVVVIEGTKASEWWKQWWDQEDSNLRPQHYQFDLRGSSKLQLFTEIRADLEFCWSVDAEE